VKMRLRGISMAKSAFNKRKELLTQNMSRAIKKRINKDSRLERSTVWFRNIDS
jgi:hypothetical protein